MWGGAWLGVLGCACGGAKAPPATPESPAPIPAEARVHNIELGGPLAVREAEFSGLAWMGDTLLLLPQYPGRFPLPEAPGGSIGALSKREIEDWLACHVQELAWQPSDRCPEAALTPAQWPVDDSAVRPNIDAFEGYEALVVDGQRAFLTAEITGPPHDIGYVLRGHFTAESPPKLVLDPPAHRVVLPRALPNTGLEALLLHDDTLLALYEACGVRRLHAHYWQPLAPVPMTHVAYRITDATSPDSRGRFWAINYRWPGDDHPGPHIDRISERYGRGATHRQTDAVERLLAFDVRPEGVVLADQAPISLRLDLERARKGRNWEGLVRFKEGFLIASDRHPQSWLAYVHAPHAARLP